jgi:hypothetical protein
MTTLEIIAEHNKDNEKNIIVVIRKSTNDLTILMDDCKYLYKGSFNADEWKLDKVITYPTESENE